MGLKRFDVVLVRLDPTIGREIKKTRPGIIISPDEINNHWNPVVIVPLTSTLKALDFRVDVKFEGKTGQAAIDQIKAVDKSRIVKKLGTLSKTDSQSLQRWLEVFFQESPE